MRKNTYEMIADDFLRDLPETEIRRELEITYGGSYKVTRVYAYTKCGSYIVIGQGKTRPTALKAARTYILDNFDSLVLY